MTELEYGRRPQVLLLGNGLARCYGGDSWDALLKNISVRDDIPDKLKCPMPLQAILVTNNNVKDAMKDAKKIFYGEVDEKLLPELQKLLSCGFDDILTTNYSFEIEAAAAGKRTLSDYYIRKNCKNINEKERAEGRYMIHTYQKAEFNDHINRIWHIHGDARRPDSMILGHYYYASLLNKMIEYVHSRGNIYNENQIKKRPLHIGSWLDSFIMGDIYVLGFGFDFSEIDLWWLLNRKKREKAPDHGNVYFYAPSKDCFDEKKELLKLLNVEIIDCGINIKETDSKERKNTLYGLFYERAVESICGRIKEELE